MQKVIAAALVGAAAGRLADPMNLLGNTATVCSPAGALASNFVVTVSPDTVSKGDVVTTTFDFDLSETITAGSVVYSGSYNGMPFSQDADLCTEVAKSGDPCPLSVGHHKQVSTATADYTGKVETKINWTTTDGRAILCADVTVKVA